MKLRYVGPNPTCVVMMKNAQGGMGTNIAKDEVFECPAQVAADLMARFNVDPLKPCFIEASEDSPKKEYTRKRRKIVKDEDVKKTVLDEPIKEL